ncbi:uncharacterized protein GBIM_20578 [Gryllus bimaculatus]|nr:uncharacterized protein GBIM_20578 [Gryllus bimaculatus]
MFAGRRFTRAEHAQVRAVSKAAATFARNVDPMGGAVSQTPWLRHLAPKATGFHGVKTAGAVLTDLVKITRRVSVLYEKKHFVNENNYFILPFVEAVLRETLRRNTMLPLAMPHLTVEDTKLDGYDIPKSMFVVLAALLQNFCFELASDKVTPDCCLPGLTLTPKDTWMRATPRA